MRAQLDHLLDGGKLAGVSIQAIPFGSGAHAAMGAAFTILLLLEPPGGEVAGLRSADYVDRDQAVRAYSGAFDGLSSIAVDEFCCGISREPAGEEPGSRGRRRRMPLRMRRPRRTWACSLVVIAFVLAACGRTPVTSLDAVRGAMLRPGDVAATWTVEPQDDAAVASYPTLCGSPNVDRRFPDVRRANVVLAPTAPDSAAPGAGEFVWLYADEKIAQQAFAAVEDGYTCRTGTYSGESFAVDPLDDPVSGFEADDVRGWRVVVGRTNTVYLVRTRNLVALLSFSAGSDAVLATLPDRNGLARLAVSRLHDL